MTGRVLLTPLMLLGLAAHCIIAPARAQDVTVYLTSPEAGVSVAGTVDITAEVIGIESVIKVELWADHELVGELRRPPFTLSIDLGEENREHHFEALAFTSEGEIVRWTLDTPAIRVDDEIDAELQQLYVTVVDEDRRVLNLTRQQFQIRDNGAPQTIVTFSGGETPLAATVLIDSSASMKGRRLGFALRGAARFAGSLQDSDEMSIRLFSDRLLLATPFSNNREILTSSLAGIEANGGTALNDHLYLALKELEARQGRRVVVLLSDGIDSHSVLRMRDVKWLSRRTRAMIYWIRLEPGYRKSSRFSAWKNPDEYRREYALLEETVIQSGGRIVVLEGLEQTEQAVREILEELREQYVLGYYPSNSRDDGGWHQVRVSLVGSAHHLRTRGGYIDY